MLCFASLGGRNELLQTALVSPYQAVASLVLQFGISGVRNCVAVCAAVVALQLMGLGMSSPGPGRSRWRYEMRELRMAVGMWEEEPRRKRLWSQGMYIKKCQEMFLRVWCV